nr:RuvA C-terminal domain-containing protein [Dehalococcoidia bacterium]
IIAHLRGKLVQEALLQDRDGHTPVAAPDIRADAVDALVALQYGRREAEALVQEAFRTREDLDSLEAVLRHVLEQQARGG